MEGFYYAKCIKCGKPFVLRVMLGKLYVWFSDAVIGGRTERECQNCGHPLSEKFEK